MKLTSRMLVAALLVTNSVVCQSPDSPRHDDPRHDDQGPARAYWPAADLDQEEPIPTLQAPRSNRLPSLRTPIHTADNDLGQQYGIWAAGDSYKVSFHEGMRFIPYLGSEYPVTQFLGWQTVSAKLGATELLENPTATPAQHEWRYEYQFGPITETYDVRGEGLEQTFVLHHRPAPGDLVIRGAVTSKLHAKPCTSAHQSLVFFDEQDRAIIEYGEAIAFDARGARVLVETAYSNGSITLTVPGDWVEGATLPITVDPLLTAVVVADGGFAPYGKVTSIDIARDDEAVSNNVMIAYTRSVSATDSDLWVRLGNEDFSGHYSNLVFSDITSSWVTDQTSCAFVGGANRWAVVFRRYFRNATIRVSRLRCHVHNSGDTSLQSNVAALNAPSGRNDWRPDIGGVQSFASGNNAMIVFQREDNGGNGGNFVNSSRSSVHGCLFDATAPNGSFGSAFAIKPSAGHDNERPSINQVAEGGSSFSWICVYQRFIDGATNEDWDLLGARIAQNGAVASGAWSSDLANVSPKQHQLGPIVEGTLGRYAVTFATVDVPSVNFKTGLIAGKQVQLERFDWDHAATSPSGSHPNRELRSSIDRRWEATDLAYDTTDESHWVAGFRSVPPGVGILYYNRVGYTGASTTATSDQTLFAVVGYQGSGSACVFDNDYDSFLFAYSADNGAGSNSVYGQTLTYSTPVTPTTFGVSCSNANLNWSGSQQIGAEFNSVDVTGAPVSAIHIMLAATVTTNVPVVHPIIFPGCRLFVMAAGPGFLGAFPAAFGANVSWQLALPEFLGSQTLYFQDWYIDVNGLLYSTERLAVPIIK